MIALVTSLLLLAPPHDAPVRRAVELSRQMQKAGRTAHLLHQRAVCFLELRRMPSALKDLRAALQLDPNHAPSLVEHVRVLADLDRAELAAAATDDALRRLKEPMHRATAAVAHADLLLRRGEDRRAIERCDTALRAVPNHIAAAYRRSVLRGALGQHTLRLRELDAFVQRLDVLTPVIEIEWIDAMIATRDPRALPRIERKLAECRHRSAWLIRRAAVVPKTRAADLMAALRELGPRIHPRHADPMLLAERALARHRLGLDVRTDLTELQRRRFPTLLMRKLRTRQALHFTP